MCISFDKFFVFDLETLTSKEVLNFEEYAAADDTVNQQEPATSDKKETKVSTMDNWTIFITSFLGGFVALLTPCVFPMIPMTVSFFTKQSKSRAKGLKNALIDRKSVV